MKENTPLLETTIKMITINTLSVVQSLCVVLVETSVIGYGISFRSGKRFCGSFLSLTPRNRLVFLKHSYAFRQVTVH